MSHSVGLPPQKKPLRKSKRTKNTPRGDGGGVVVEKDRARGSERERQTTTTTTY